MEMPLEVYQELKASLIKHEGYKRELYKDVRGKWTIGVGYNIEDRGLKDSVVNELFTEDMDFFYHFLSQFPWFLKINSDRQVVLCDMAYNLGAKDFLEFHSMIEALERQDYDAAADAMLGSEWAKQLKQRATDLAEGMRTGKYGTTGKF